MALVLIHLRLEPFLFNFQEAHKQCIIIHLFKKQKNITDIH